MKNLSEPVFDLSKMAGKAGLLQWIDKDNYDLAEQTIADLKQLNVNKLRTGISWADFYTEGAWEWYDWLLPRLAKQADLLPCVLYTPPSLGLEPKTSAPPLNPKDYADFIDVILSRYGKYFDYIELWNEPNNIIEYDYTLDRTWQRFSEMIGSAAYWAKHRGWKTVLGGLSPVDPSWLALMFERGLMQYIDAVGIHGFPHVFDQQWDGWATQLKRVRDVLDEYNSKQEVWITEAGFSTWQKDEYRQMEEFRKVLKADTERVYWYSMQDLAPEKSAVGGFHTDEREYHFGLKKADGTPKLLYRMWSEYGIEGLYNEKQLYRNININTANGYALVFGGAGFIGTNLASRLFEEGKRVMIYDNLSRPGVEHNLQWLQQTYGDRLSINIADIRDERTVKQAVSRADEIYHYAAQVAVTTSLDKPVHDFEINVAGTINILEAVRARTHRPSLIFTSTNKVYGGLEDLEFISNGSRYYPADADIKKYGINESRNLDFHSPYGCSKGSADQYIIDYARTYGIPASVFRMSCIYGPHQYGNEDQGWVAHFIIRALEGKPLNIYGNGKQVRDILYVEDLVNAFLLARDNIRAVSGQAFNIGGGPANTVSLIELLKKLEHFGLHTETKFGDWRPGDQCYYVSDIRKFSEATGWEPQYDVDAGLSGIYNWLMENRPDLKQAVDNIKRIKRSKIKETPKEALV